jgi:hypothetical protein
MALNPTLQITGSRLESEIVMVTGLILFATIKQFQISFSEVHIIPSTIQFWTREYTSRSLIDCWRLFTSLKWLRFIRPMHSNPCVQHHEKTDTKTLGSHNTQQLFHIVGVKNVVLLKETGGPWKWRIDTNVTNKQSLSSTMSEQIHKG